MGDTTEEGDIPKRATTLSLAGVDLDRTGSVPLHRQLYDELRGAIFSGRMAGGARLPSTRGLAAELGVARLTVLEAFEQLYADGYVEGRSGSGTLAGTSRIPATLVAYARYTPTSFIASKSRPYIR
jgi:GntR family transcriptional regulator/MocR family aminotransferase